MAALFLVVFFSHGLSPSATSSDSHWIVPQMLSMVRSGDTDINEYPELLRQHEYQAVVCVDGEHGIVRPVPGTGCPGAAYHLYYPIGAALAALPVFCAMDLSLRAVGPVASSLLQGRAHSLILAFFQRDYLTAFPVVEVVIASFLIACTTVVVFFIGRLFLSVGRALMLALVFAFGTAAWSTASRALWQHGPQALALSVGIYLLLQARSRPGLLPWTAVPLTFAYFTRPTGSVVVAAIGAYIWIHHRDRFLRWALLAAATAAPFVIYYYSIYHRPLPPYYTTHHLLAPALSSVGPFLSAFTGHLLSPSRGLLTFSPVLLFSVAGAALAFRKRWNMPLAGYLIAAVGLHWVVISTFADWTAGYCFGPRYSTEVLPVFVFFLIPAFEAYTPGRTPRLLVAAFGLCLAVSVFIHMRGAVDWSVQGWNHPGVSPARAWDWRDPQFLRGLFR